MPHPDLRWPNRNINPAGNPRLLGASENGKPLLDSRGVLILPVKPEEEGHDATT
jgi:hypothetical protein